MAFYYVHHSGRYSFPPNTLVKGFDNDRAKGGKVIAFTEVDAENRANALRARAKEVNYGFYRPGETADDVAFVWDAEIFEYIHGYGKILSSIKTYSTDGHLLKPFAGTFLVLRRRADNKRYLFAAVHTPSHVDVGTGWRKKGRHYTNRVRQYLEGMRNFNKELNSALKAFKINGGRVISADFNISIIRLWARAYLKATFPGFRLALDRQKKPTHDHRTIDGVLMGGRIRQASDVRVWDSVDSDHNAVGVLLDNK